MKHRPLKRLAKGKGKGEVGGKYPKSTMQTKNPPQAERAKTTGKTNEKSQIAKECSKTEIMDKVTTWNDLKNRLFDGKNNFLGYLGLVTGIDIALHSQRLFDQSLEQHHQRTALILFTATLFRTALKFLFILTCQKKLMPARMITHLHHMLMTVLFAFHTLTMVLLLLDSEFTKEIYYFPYLSLVVANIVFSFLDFCYCLRYGCNSLESPPSRLELRRKKLKENQEDSEYKRGSDWQMIKKLLWWHKSAWRIILAGYIFLVIGRVAHLSESPINAQIIDAITSDNPLEVLPRAVLMFTVFHVIGRVAIDVKTMLAQKVGKRISMKTKVAMFRNVLHQDAGFFDSIKMGEILSHLGYITSDIEHFWNSVEHVANLSIKIVGTTFVIFWMSWKLSILIVLGCYWFLLPNNISTYIAVERWRLVEHMKVEGTIITTETVRNIRTVKSFANEDMEEQKYVDIRKEMYHTTQKDRHWNLMLQFLGTFAWAGAKGIVYLYGGYLVVKGEISPGNLVTFLLYMQHVWIDLSQLIEKERKDFIKNFLKMDKFFEYIERTPQVVPSGKETLQDLNGKVEFNKVSFRYPTRPDASVLKSLSFTVEPGQVVALVGSSGGGKSTCVNLIERFYDPLGGTVTIDGVPVEDFDNKFLHNKISLVAQEPVLFGRSIEDNIKYGKLDASHEEVVQSAKDANAHGFIMALKDGYETDVGEAGTQISGGQKQRIAIARALIRNPKVMLLDEATSALDAESECLVQEALQKSMKGRTVIIIAHRLSTVEHANKIVVIDRGQVVEEGTHQSLVEKNGFYNNLVKKQLRKMKNREE